MTVGVHGLPAERAEGTPGSHYFPCALGKCAGGAHRHFHQHHFGYFSVVLIEGFVVIIRIADGVSLDDHLRRCGVPTQAHRAGSELLFNGLERIVIDQFDGSSGGNAEGIALKGVELVENIVNLLREQSCLLLLHGDSHDLLARAYLQVEGARSRNTDGADDNPVRPGKLVNKCRHVSSLGDMNFLGRWAGTIAWAMLVLASMALIVIGLSGTLFFVWAPEPALVEKANVGRPYVYAGCVLSVTAALLSHVRGNPIWVTVCVGLVGMLVGWAAWTNPYNLLRHLAVVVTFPLALAGIAEVMWARGYRQR